MPDIPTQDQLDRPEASWNIVSPDSVDREISPDQTSLPDFGELS